MQRVLTFSLLILLIFVSKIEAATKIDAAAIEKVERTFEDFPDNEHIQKISVQPKLNGPSRLARKFAAQISEGLKAGPNFAGKFSIIQVGCGTECLLAFIVNNETGNVLDFPIGGEHYRAMNLKFTKDSNLVIASFFIQGTCHFLYFFFDKKSFKKIKNQIIEPPDKCYQQF